MVPPEGRYFVDLGAPPRASIDEMHPQPNLPLNAQFEVLEPPGVARGLLGGVELALDEREAAVPEAGVGEVDEELAVAAREPGPAPAPADR